MITDLAVPLSPPNMIGYFIYINYSKKYEYLVVSTVGTNILLNLPSSGG